MTDTRQTTAPPGGASAPRRLGAAVGAALVVLTTAACAQSDDTAAVPLGPQTTSTQAELTTTTATPTATASLSARERAARDAEAAYRRYIEVDDRVRQGGGEDLEAYKSVTAGVEYVEAQRAVTMVLAEREWRTEGSTRIENLQVKSVDLKSSPPDTYPTVILTACLDTSDVNILGPEGQPTGDPNRQRRYATTAYVTDIEGGWKVTETRMPGDPC